MRIFWVVALLAPVAAMAAGSTVTPPPLSSDTIVATRGGVSLRVSHVDAKVRSMPDNIREGYLLDRDRMARLVDSTLLTLQLAKAAEDEGLADSQAFLDDMALKRAELLAQRAVETHMAGLPAPNVATLARERYQANPDVYRPAPVIELRHILFNTDGRDEALAKSEAEQFLAELNQGKDFIELAKTYVERVGEEHARTEVLVNPDTSRLDTRFAAELMKLRKEGDLAGPVRSRFGYHVIRLDTYEQPALPPFDEVSEKLIEGLAEEQRSKDRSIYMSTFSKQEPEINGDAVRELPYRYAPALREQLNSAQEAAPAGVPQP